MTKAKKVKKCRCGHDIRTHIIDLDRADIVPVREECNHRKCLCKKYRPIKNRVNRHRHKWYLGSIGWDGNFDQSKKYQYRCETCPKEKYSATRLENRKP